MSTILNNDILDDNFDDNFDDDFSDDPFDDFSSGSDDWGGSSFDFDDDFPPVPSSPRNAGLRSDFIYLLVLLFASLSIANAVIVWFAQDYSWWQDLRILWLLAAFLGYGATTVLNWLYRSANFRSENFSIHPWSRLPPIVAFFSALIVLWHLAKLI